jgi:hypothetical protein
MTVFYIIKVSPGLLTLFTKLKEVFCFLHFLKRVVMPKNSTP